MFSEPRREKTLILLAMCFALFMTMLDNTVVNVSLPSIQRELGSGVSGLQWIIDAYALVFASLLLSAGALGDRFGRKRAFLLGMAVFVLGSALCALAPSLGWLIAGRVIQGAGSAALLPGTLSILTVAFRDPRERAQAIGIWAGVSALALALGPVLGGILTDAFGWQSVFWLNVPVGAAALVMATRVVPESSDPEGRRLDLPGQLLAIIGVGSVTFALIEGETMGWRSPVIVASFVVSALALAAFVVVEQRSASPMLPLRFFRDSTFAAANVIGFLLSFGMFGTFFFMSLYLQNVKGYSPSAAGIRILATTAAMMFISPLTGRLVGRFGPKLPLAIGCMSCGTGLLLLSRLEPATPFSSFWWQMSMLGVGMSLAMPSMTAAVMGSVPPARAGVASAVSNTSRQMGGVFGIALLGTLVSARAGADPSPARFTDGINAAFTVGGVALVACAILAFTLVRAPERELEQVDLPTGEAVAPA